MGRDFTARQVSEPEVTRPASQITAQLRDPMQNNYVLPSHFSSVENQQPYDSSHDSSWPMNMSEYRQVRNQLHSDAQPLSPQKPVQ